MFLDGINGRNAVSEIKTQGLSGALQGWKNGAEVRKKDLTDRFNGLSNSISGMDGQTLMALLLNQQQMRVLVEERFRGWEKIINAGFIAGQMIAAGLSTFAGFAVPVPSAFAAAPAATLDETTLALAKILLKHPELLAKAYQKKTGTFLNLQGSGLVVHEAILSAVAAHVSQDEVRNELTSRYERAGVAYMKAHNEPAVHALVRPSFGQLIAVPYDLQRRPLEVNQLRQMGLAGEIHSWVLTDTPFEFPAAPEMRAAIRDHGFTVEAALMSQLTVAGLEFKEALMLLQMFSQAAPLRAELRDAAANAFPQLTWDGVRSGLSYLAGLANEVRAEIQALRSA